ncbi:UNVERIFIED_CONTAM: hypothetical protein FKN15_077932 [Acipenser sinensis]
METGHESLSNQSRWKSQNPFTQHPLRTDLRALERRELPACSSRCTGLHTPCITEASS